jgi:hypothetical protein
MKRCKKCLLFKPMDEFYRHKEMADGRFSACKLCARKAVAANRKAKAKYYRQYDLDRCKLPHRRELHADVQRILRLRKRKRQGTTE